MTRAMARPATRIWLALMVITCVTTWGLTEKHVPIVIGTVGVLLLAALKVGLITANFMEVKQAPLPWQAFFAGWVVVSTALILGFYFAT